MPLSTQQVEQFRQQALAAGKSPADIERYLASKGYGPSPGAGGSVANLAQQFEGTQALPTNRVAGPGEDPGFVGMASETLKETVLGPFVGIAERIGLADEGSRQDIRSDFEENRVNYLAADPSAFRTVLAGLTEGAGQMLPLTPGGVIGKKAAHLAARAGIGAVGTKVAAGAAAGLAEGTLVGIGDTVGLPVEDQLKRGALMALAGAGFGTLGGVRAGQEIRGILKDADPKQREFLNRYIADNPESKGILDRVHETFVKVRNHWVDIHSASNDVPLRVEKALKKAGAPQAEIDAVRSMGKELYLREESAKTGDDMALSPVERETMSPLTEEPTGEGLKQIFEELAPDERADVIVAGMAKRQLEKASQQAQGAKDLAGLKSNVKDLKKQQKEAQADRDAGALSAKEHSAVKKYLSDELKAAKQEIKRVKPDSEMSIKESSNADSREILREIETKYADPNRPDINASLQRFKDWSVRAMLDPLVEVGVFSRQEYADITAKNQWYMPFVRATLALQSRGSEFGMGAPKKGKRLHGGLDEERLMLNPLENAAEMSVKIHSFARKQAVRNQLADIADKHADILGDEIGPVDGQHLGDTFRVWREGELVNYRGDKELIRSLESLSFKEASLVARAAMQATQIFRAGATLTPEFSSRNLFKDWFTFATMSEHTNFGALSIARAMGSELMHRMGNGWQASKTWKDFQRSVGYHSTWVGKDRTGRGVERSVKIGRDIAKRTGVGGTAANMAGEMKRNPLAPFQAFGQMIERMPRYTEYKAAKKKGLTHREAGAAAGEATLPFHRAGELGRKVNGFEAFFNAQMQDLSKFYRAMKKHPFRTTARGMAWMTVPTMAAWARNADDPDYHTIPEWEKTLFIHTHKMENGKWFRVPIPPGVLGLAFSYFPRKMLDFYNGKDPNAVRKVLSETVEQTPLQYVPLPFGMNPIEDAVVRAMPNAIQPAMELITNHNPFFDMPVMSERLLGRDPLEQKTPYTTNLATGIAKALDKMPGLSGTKATSPGTVDYLLSGYGAGIARTAAQWTGNTAPRRPGKRGLMDLPGLRGLQSTSPVGFSSQPVQDLYDLSENIDQSWNTLRIQSDMQKKRDYLSMHPEAAYSKQMGKAKERLKKFSKQRESVMNAAWMNDTERADALLKIDQAITMFAGTMMGEFYKAIDRDKKIEQYNEVNP